MSTGSKLDAISAMFWFCSSVMTICRYPRPQNQYENIQQQQPNHRQPSDLDLEIVSSPSSSRKNNQDGDDDDDDMQGSGEHTTEGGNNVRDGIMVY